MNRTPKQVLVGLLPGTLRYRLIGLKRRALFDAFRRKGLVYIHVPRTGGTSLSDTLFEFWVDHFTVRQHDLTMPADVKALPRFAVVRNPWERLLSCWAFVCAGRGHDERIFVMNRHKYEVAAFSSFERFVLEWLPAQNVQMGDPLFLPQVNFLRNHSDVITLDHIGRTDNMAATEAWVSQQTGKQLTLPHYNKSSHGPYRDYYTTEMKRVVEQVYGEDIDRLKFTF